MAPLSNTGLGTPLSTHLGEVPVPQGLLRIHYGLPLSAIDSPFVVSLIESD